MIERIRRAVVITIVRQQMVAGERVTGAPSAWKLAGKSEVGYARLLSLAAWSLEGEVPACIRCRVRAEKVGRWG